MVLIYWCQSSTCLSSNLLISSGRTFGFHMVYLLPGAEDEINGQEEGSGGGVFMNSDTFLGDWEKN